MYSYQCNNNNTYEIDEIFGSNDRIKADMKNKSISEEVSDAMVVVLLRKLPAQTRGTIRERIVEFSRINDEKT